MIFWEEGFETDLSEKSSPLTAFDLSLINQKSLSTTNLITNPISFLSCRYTVICSIDDLLQPSLSLSDRDSIYSVDSLSLSSMETTPIYLFLYSNLVLTIFAVILSIFVDLEGKYLFYSDQRNWMALLCYPAASDCQQPTRRSPPVNQISVVRNASPIDRFLFLKSRASFRTRFTDHTGATQNLDHQSKFDRQSDPNLAIIRRSLSLLLSFSVTLSRFSYLTKPKGYLED